MKVKEIAEALEKYTIEKSNFDEKRNYISMSHSHLSVEELIEQYTKGFEKTKDICLKCYKGYQMEEDMISRLNAVFKEKITNGGEIEVFAGIVKGHPDFRFENNPADLKSVLMDDWIPKEKVPYKVYCQMQSYMMYSNRDRGLVIYESRETGIIKAFDLFSNNKLQKEIHNKFREVVKKLNG